MFEQKFAFSIVIFFHMREFDFDFYCFYHIFHRIRFFLVNENSSSCGSGLVLLCYFNSLYLLITVLVLHKS